MHQNESQRKLQYLQDDSRDLITQYYPETIDLYQKIKKTRMTSKCSQSVPLLKRKSLIAEQSIKKRYRKFSNDVKQKINKLENSCDKFGGSTYIKDQMNRQKITTDSQQKFYVQQIKSNYGDTSLPKIALYPHLHQSHPLFEKIHIKNTPHSNKNKDFNKYNKWFIKPKDRFSHRGVGINISKVSQLTQQMTHKKISIKDYVKELTSPKGQSMKELKDEFAPSLIEGAIKKLGREPLICNFTNILKR